MPPVQRTIAHCPSDAGLTTRLLLRSPSRTKNLSPCKRRRVSGVYRGANIGQQGCSRVALLAANRPSRMPLPSPRCGQPATWRSPGPSHAPLRSAGVTVQKVALGGTRVAPRSAPARPSRARVVACSAGLSGKVNKVVLAYSGGLDTSVILKWLQETYDCEVCAAPRGGWSASAGV
jgi:hypothetical protein